jgi:arginyl-tRNA--protein-N-Asp/Glu arginylyltransferase
MSIDSGPEFKRLRLFLTEPHPCSYLDDQTATTAFVDPEVMIDHTSYNRLSEYGFRRSGKYLYTPRCESCKACISTRVLAQLFQPSRQQKRCIKKNNDLKVILNRRINSTEHYQLYEKYISARHSDGDMFPANEPQYNNFIGASMEFSRFLEFRLDGKLIAASAVDLLESGLSAIYTYYDPDYSQRGLGNFAILSMLELTKASQLPYLYLGYMIKKCPKMNYKTRYRPLELFVNGVWQEYNGK